MRTPPIVMHRALRLMRVAVLPAVRRALRRQRGLVPAGAIAGLERGFEGLSAEPLCRTALVGPMAAARGVLTMIVALGVMACGDALAPLHLSLEPDHEDPYRPGDDAPEPGPAHVYVANADGDGIVRRAPGSWPSWSPDGERIAFHRAPQTPMPPLERAQKGELYVIQVDASDETFLGHGIHPSWSPDGQKIVFTDASGISVMNADGSAVTNLIPHDFRDDTYAPWDMGVGKPSWSPDGKRIAFEHLGDGDIQPAQMVMNADGSEPRRLTTSADGRRYAESDPAWSPDGSSIVFWSFGYGIAVVDANGGVPRTVYRAFPAVVYGARPAWAPDGSSIAFTANRGSPAGPSIWVVGVGTGSGSAEVLLPDGYDPAWSPDGDSIAFVSADE